MKLAATVKLLSTKNRIKQILLLITIFSCHLIQAQTGEYQITYKNIQLSDALLETAKHFDVKVAFDAQLTEKTIINKKVSGNTPEEFITNLLSGTGFNYQFKHNQYLIFEDNNINPVNKDDYAELIGTIIDRDSRELLPYATIQLPLQNITVPATANGSFYVRFNKSGSVRLIVNYIGYYTIDTILKCLVSPCICSIPLTSKAQSIDLVEVKEPRLEMVDYRNNVDFATTINPGKLNDLPSLAETDIFRALQLLPGISFSENNSELNIRGGTGDQNLVLFDGQTLYNLSHYYSVFSSVNPSIVKDIQVYKGGYDSRYGERISGIVDITGKSGNQLKPMVYGNINLISGNIAAEVPVGKKLTLVVAGRRSYSDIYSTSLAESYLQMKTSSNLPRFDNINQVSTTPKFYFYDYNAKATYRISDKENISFGVNGGKDNYSNSFDINVDRGNALESDSSIWKNYGVSAIWTKQWNGAFYSCVQAGSSGYKTDNYRNSLTTSKIEGFKGIEGTHGWDFMQNNFNTNTLADISFAIKNIWYINNNNQLDFGILTRQNNIKYYNKVDTIARQIELLIRDDINQSALISSIYIQDRIRISDRLSVKPGLRFDYYNKMNKVYFEPRFSVGYKINEKLSIRFATGSFYQFIGQTMSQSETGYNNNFWLLAEKNVRPVMNSNHFIIGATFEKGNFLFDFETYYKTLSGLQEYITVLSFGKNVDWTRNKPRLDTLRNIIGGSLDLINIQDKQKIMPSYFFTGNGKSYGTDFSIRYRYKIFTSWVSYSISKCVYTFPDLNYGKETLAPTDHTHQLSLANMLTIGKWNFGTTTLFSTGRPYIYETDTINSIPVIRYYKRLPNYFRTDVTASYNFNLKKVRIKTGATIINVFNNQNSFDINFRKVEMGPTSSYSYLNNIKAQELSLNLFLYFIF